MACTIKQPPKKEGGGGRPGIRKGKARASQLPKDTKEREEGEGITYHRRVSARAGRHPHSRAMTGGALLSPAGSTSRPALLLAPDRRIRSRGYLLSSRIIQAFVAAAAGSALAASFTSRPCSHARTHIHTDEALCQPPSPPRNSRPRTRCSRTAADTPRSNTPRPPSRATRSPRYLHHNSDFFFLPAASFACRYLAPSPPRADRSRWAPLRPRAGVLLLSLGPTPSAPRARVCICRARGAHRLSAAVTPGKHETRRERRTDGQRALDDARREARARGSRARRRGFPATWSSPVSADRCDGRPTHVIQTKPPRP